MPDEEFAGGAQRAKEEDFFHKRERELIEKMRLEAQAAAACRELGEATGIADEALLRDLQSHGFTPQTANLLNLAPLVLVAWGDGSVSPKERKAITVVARQLGLEAGSPSHDRLAGWLDARPSDDFFRSALQARRAVLDALPAEERDRRERELVSHCAAIARASGGVLGLGSKISAAERLVIRDTAEQLGYSPEMIREIEEEDS
jgi:tellurite resistance protein